MLRHDVHEYQVHLVPRVECGCVTPKTARTQPRDGPPARSCVSMPRMYAVGLHRTFRSSQTCRKLSTAPTQQSHEAIESGTSRSCVSISQNGICVPYSGGLSQRLDNLETTSRWEFPRWRARCPTLATSRTRASVDPDALPAAAPS